MKAETTTESQEIFYWGFAGFFYVRNVKIPANEIQKPKGTTFFAIKGVLRRNKAI